MTQYYANVQTETGEKLLIMCRSKSMDLAGKNIRNRIKKKGLDPRTCEYKVMQQASLFDEVGHGQKNN